MRTLLAFVGSVHQPVTHAAKKNHLVTNRHKDLSYLPPTQCDSVYVLCVTQVARYVWNKTDFDAVDPETTDYLMGELFYLFIYF